MLSYTCILEGCYPVVHQGISDDKIESKMIKEQYLSKFNKEFALPRKSGTHRYHLKEQM